MAVSKPNQKLIHIFYSYAHEDEKFREKLEKHLTLLKRQGLIHGWHDREITAGREWAGAIDENLEASQIILFLVSADFLASDYCYDTEMTQALKKHATNQARVIPIIIRDVDWHCAPFSKLQALPKDGKPVSAWRPQDKAWTDVAKGIRKVVEELTVNPLDASPNSDGTPSERPWNVPHQRNLFFTGREEVLEKLHEQSLWENDGTSPTTSHQWPRRHRQNADCG